jgi:hypothetical protein
VSGLLFLYRSQTVSPDNSFPEVTRYARIAELTPRLWKTNFADNPLRCIAYTLSR